MSWGDVAEPSPTARQMPVGAIPADTRPPPSWGQAFMANVRLSQDDDSDVTLGRKLDAYDNLEHSLIALGYSRDRYHNLPGRNVLASLTDMGEASWDGTDLRANALWSDVQAARQKNPKNFADLPQSQSDFEAWAAGEKGRHQHDQELSAQGGFGSALVPGLSLGIMSMFEPQNLWTLGAAGAGKSLAGTMGRQALVNTQMQILNTSNVAQARKDLGDGYTTEQGLTDLAMAAGGGAVFGGIGHVAGQAISKVQANRAAKLGALDDGALADHVENTVPPEQRTPTQQDAINILARQQRVNDSNPFVQNAAGMEAFDNYMRAGTATLQSAQDGSAPVHVPVPLRPAAPLDQNSIIQFTMHDLEGGSAIAHWDTKRGGVTKYGFAQAKHPELDVPNMTEAQATALYHKDYWFKGLDQADPATALVAYDAGVTGGPAVGKRILAQSGGDAEKALSLYRDRLNALADTDPNYPRKGWMARIDRIERRIQGMAKEHPTLLPDGHESQADWQVSQNALEAERMGEMPRAPAVPQEPLPPATSDVHINMPTEEPISADASSSPDASQAPAQVPQDAAAQAKPFAPENYEAVKSYVADTRHPMDEAVIARRLGMEVPEVRAIQGQLLQDGVIDRRTITEKQWVKKARGDGGYYRNTAIGEKYVRKSTRDMRPRDALEYLASQGGLRDTEGHSLARGMGLDYKFPMHGPLIRKSGMTLADAGEKLYHAGFSDPGFDSVHVGGGQPTTAETLSLLDRAHQARQSGDRISSTHSDFSTQHIEDAHAFAKENAEAIYRVEAGLPEGVGEHLTDAEKVDIASRALMQKGDLEGDYGYAAATYLQDQIIRDMDDALHETGDASYVRPEYDENGQIVKDAADGGFDGARASGDQGQERFATDPGPTGAPHESTSGYTGASGTDGGALGPIQQGLADAAAQRLADSKSFSDPVGAEAHMQADRLIHNLEATAETDETLYHLDGAEPQSIAAVLKSFKDESAAIDALRNCL